MQKKKKLMLKSLLSDDKKSNKVQDLGVQNEGNFEKNAIFGAMSLKIISLTIVFKPHYKLVKSIVDLSFMTTRSKDYAPKKSTCHS